MKKINIKNSVRNNVVGIDDFNTQTTETIAKVIESSKRSNTCTINYINNENNAEIKTNVVVRISDPDTLGWYPKKDDYVLIKLSGNVPIIIGDATQMVYNNKLREKTSFVNNIFASVNEALGGFLI